MNWAQQAPLFHGIFQASILEWVAISGQANLERQQSDATYFLSPTPFLVLSTTFPHL